jgi:methionine synthase II (cobalamin-independent)
VITEPSRPGRASGIGSWPGTDMAEAIRTVLGELPDPHLSYLPELPARGPGAEMVGRGATLLVDLPVDLQPSGWRLVGRPGRDLGRSRALLHDDLDILAELADGWTGPLKLQVAGPWTLAAELWLPRLERAVADPGARRDLIDSLAEGIAQHLRDIRRLIPGAQPVLQLDEPALPAVLTGRLRTASGFGRLSAVQESEVVPGLRTVLSAARAAGAVTTVVHCCAADVPIAALARTGADAVSLDLSLLSTADWETVAGTVESGLALWAGVVPVRDTPPPVPELADLLWRPWRSLGLATSRLDEVVITPACGLAGVTPAGARAVLTRTRETATELAERGANLAG